MADEAALAKDPLAVEFGRRGGKARLTKMSSEDRRRIAKIAAQARWAKKHGAPAPDPTDPQGPQHRDRQSAEAGILLNARKLPAACRPIHPDRKASASLSLFDLEGDRVA